MHFAVYFWREKTSKLDSAHKECPAASKLLTALGLQEERCEEEGESWNVAVPAWAELGWTGETPGEAASPHSACSYPGTQTSHGKVSF